ncbi:MFS domain-containing protein [Caenorhabditis elegans]|uniref:MFS domain-containing protein n=1 Tax=Caenorhabditis elegans TaxID=6239 RepID=H2KZ09_CAEEL|nr:MFS domain-containing protein [Caenorhabditis elegans]CCD65647.1 MFS domain-containing protein [Caenorhabditis elegans]|eukprot:NP_505341.1 Serpentine Receptor, class SX [Caenorhabditis elegans]
MEVPTDSPIVHDGILLEKEQLMNKDKDDRLTNWRLIITAAVVSCLNAVENSVLGIGEWPYMREIDPNATAQFFGLATSASKCGHAVFALIFSIWSYKTSSVKIPLIASRLIAIAACMIYLTIEYVKTDKRYVLMAVYTLLGIANSGGTVLRGYVTLCSSNEDRPRAFAALGLSFIFSIIVGPTIQLIFSAIPYPGYEIIPGIWFHLYSAPIWISFILTILTVFVILILIEDISREKKTKLRPSESQSSFSMERWRSLYEKLKKSNLDWKLIVVCFFVRMAVSFSHSTLSTIGSILYMVMFGWDGATTVRVGSITMVIFGVMSSTILLLYIFCHFGKILPQHKVFLFFTIAFGAVYIITYPFEFTSNPVAKYNETTRAGCNPEEYSWCSTALAVNPMLYLSVTILVAGMSIPIMSTALDTVYSRILGNIDQSVAHGAMAVIDDILYMITPIFTTTMFTLYGIGPLWIVKSMAFGIIALTWAANLKKIGEHLY